MKIVFLRFFELSDEKFIHFLLINDIFFALFNIIVVYLIPNKDEK